MNDYPEVSRHVASALSTSNPLWSIAFCNQSQVEGCSAPNQTGEKVMCGHQLIARCDICAKVCITHF